MATKGVPGTAEQFDAIAAYMAKNFGKTEDATKINVNKAKADDLEKVIGLTPDEAKALIGFRDRHGDFREWGDMLVIYGVDGAKIEAAKDKMSFWQPAPSGHGSVKSGVTEPRPEGAGLVFC